MNERPTNQRELPRLPWLSLSFAGVALALFGVSPAEASLAYTPSAATPLTLVACHFVHYSAKHALWDILTFTLLSSWVERQLDYRHALFLALAIALVPPLACALTPWVRAYAGLSGLVLGQLALLLASRARAASALHRAGYAALLGLLLIKQLYECQLGDTALITMKYEGFATVPAAHLISTLVGLAVGLIAPVPKRWRGVYLWAGGPTHDPNRARKNAGWRALRSHGP